MSNKQRGLLIIFIFAVSTLLLSACQKSLSTQPAKTPTVNAPDLFVTPMATGQNPMKLIEEFAKQTAAAQTMAANGGTPVAPESIATDVPGTPQPGDLLTPVAGVGTPTNAIVDNATVVPAASQDVSTPVPVGVRPASYTLREGEFPYCIARRFDVDPDQLLSLNGLTSPDVYYAGLVLKIPQSGSFPGGRALASHPATYTVLSSDETIYSIACKYGDLDPATIASANGLSASASLTAGQQIKIP